DLSLWAASPAGPYSGSARFEAPKPSWLEVQCRDRDACLLRMRCQPKAEFLRHGEHLAVLAQDETFDLGKSIRPGIADHVLKERPSQAAALQIRAHENTVLRLLLVRIGRETDDASQFA